MESLEKNADFKHALKQMQSGKKHLFITGKAGTGKSSLLRAFCKQSEQKQVVLAPTGLAALNVNGQTVHSFFNFKAGITAHDIKSGRTEVKHKTIYKKLSQIIIDEVSMLRADVLDCMDVFLRLHGKSCEKPFGGVRMILIGDLCQLPPVVPKHEREIFRSVYHTPYFFGAQVYRMLNVEIIELTAVYRQQDPEFLYLLNKIRDNSINSDEIQMLNTRHNPDFVPPKGKLYVHLTTTNKIAEEINQKYLNELDAPMHFSEGTIEGNVKEEYFPTVKNLYFKTGSQIILLNNDKKRRWTNGTLGTIQAVDIDSNNQQYVIVKLKDTGTLVSVHAWEWEIYNFIHKNSGITSELIGRFRQLPFKHAWAMTIHKSQGQTFDRLILDVGEYGMEHGQLYVGLSRCKSLKGIVLKNKIKKMQISMDSSVYNFLQYNQTNTKSSGSWKN